MCVCLGRIMETQMREEMTNYMEIKGFRFELGGRQRGSQGI